MAGFKYKGNGNMLRRKLKITAATFVAAYTLASPAHALFGFACIPTLYNCACSYLVPCPTIDNENLAKFVIEESQMQEKLSLLEDIRDPAAQMITALNGDTAYSIPGIGSIGIDLNGILSGNLSSLGLSSLDLDLASQLSDLGIDGDMLTSLASGQLDVDDFLSIAEDAGLDLSVLEDVGLGLDQVTALASGDLDINGVLDMAQTIGVEADILENIGITEDLLVGISEGSIDSSAIYSIAEEAGLDISSLESVGLDAATISSLSEGGSDVLASVLQDAGFDDSIISSLGLDAGLIAQISSGELPPSAINDLVEGTGIDASAITLPGVNGPITVTDEYGSNIPSAIISGMGGADLTDGTSTSSSTVRSSNIYDTITIPVESVPGLQSALDSATDTSTSESSFTYDDAEIAAMCATDRSLISTSLEPNGFGDDVENIHMAIAGGTVETAIEANDAAISVSASTSALGYARSIQMRPILIKAVEAIDTFDEMIEDSENFEEDLMVNDTIRTHLMTAEAETTSMLAYVSSTFGSGTIGNAQNLSALPIFPETARFRDLVEESSITQAQLMNEQYEQQSTAIASNMEEYTEIASEAQDAIVNYNLQFSANEIESSISSLEETIQLHEDYKSALYSLELIIRDALETLYGTENEDAAWDVLYPQMISAAVNSPYTDSDKWDDGYDTAMTLSYAVTEKTSTTDYGARAKSSQYTRISDTPYAYSLADAMADEQSDPYYVQYAPSYYRSDDEGDIYGDELVGVLQYYIETARREIFTGEIRRGDIDHVMTGDFWNEMLYNAPECLSGPIATSAAALLERPELFDLDKDCDHLYWSGGDEGDYIDASSLGGADAALWTSKINLDRIDLITGGEEAVLSDLEDAIEAISQTTVGAQLQMAGNVVPGQNLETMLTALQTAASDTSFSTTVSVPQM
jgi:hypothetical protein